MSQKLTVCSIILAAGKGTRIGLTSTHKTCLPVGGKPVIVRSIEACRAAGVSPQVVVVGDGAQHVLRTVGPIFSDVLFAYQPEPLGTGNAAKCAARLLRSMRYSGAALVTAGDKLIDEKAIGKLLRRFFSSKLDCLFLVGHREDSPGSGRVIFDERNRPVRIIETADIRRARALSQILTKTQAGQANPEFVADAIGASGIHQHKVPMAFGPLYDFATGNVRMSQDELRQVISKQKISFKVKSDRAARRISPEEADSAEYVNLSAYILKANALQYGVVRIKADNAQNEEYLTDIVEILAQAGRRRRGGFRLGTMRVDEPHQVMGFNTLGELHAMEEYVREKERSI